MASCMPLKTDIKIQTVRPASKTLANKIYLDC